MARECLHPDAQWLLGIFPDGAPSSDEEAKRVFLRHSSEGRALCFAGLAGVEDRKLVQEAATRNYGFAQALMASWSEGEEKYFYAERAAQHGEPLGMTELGNCLYEGIACQRDEARALQLYRAASDMGCWFAQYRLGERGYTFSAWQRYQLWGKAASQTENSAILGLVQEVLPHVLLHKNGGSGRIVFEIGAAMAGHVDASSRTVYTEDVSEAVFDAALWAIAFYQRCTAEAKLAVQWWIWIGKEMRVAKDIRAVIADMIWSERAAWSEKPVEQLSRSINASSKRACN